MVIQLGKIEVNVEILKKNNKNIYFRFDEVGKLLVTCNRFVSEREIKRLIKQNEKSLLRMYEKQLKKNDKQVGFSYLGESITKVYDENVKKVSIEDGMLYAKNEKMFLKWYKEECLRVFGERIHYWLPYFQNIPAFGLRIRQMKSRWGVNNVTKHIVTLNSELLKYEVRLIDYVIVHELCHFYEANHSARFWYQVGLRYPDYKMARKKLRD